MITIRIIEHPLQFKTPGGTSRGVLTDKPTWFIEFTNDDGSKGYGECSLIPKLSIDSIDELRIQFDRLTQQGFSSEAEIHALIAVCDHLPAFQFALETAWLDLKGGGQRSLFDHEFSRGEDSIPINGLIWMGSREHMLNQVKKKLASGFTCIKMKIGAIDFEEELAVLRFIRSQFSAQEIELRVDANGAFSTQDALERLKRLSDFDLHSIEQPIQPRQWEAMASLCEDSPLAIALDEELIGISSAEEKRECLRTINPQYIILKPSLVGGLAAAKTWIDIALEYNIGWWNTSALESNIGLNAIAQWTYSLNPTLPQGLGTGQLFTNNIPSPLQINNGHLTYNPSEKWMLP